MRACVCFRIIPLDSVVCWCSSPPRTSLCPRERERDNFHPHSLRNYANAVGRGLFYILCFIFVYLIIRKFGARANRRDRKTVRACATVSRFSCVHQKPSHNSNTISFKIIIIFCTRILVLVFSILCVCVHVWCIGVRVQLNVHGVCVWLSNIYTRADSCDFVALFVFWLNFAKVRATVWLVIGNFGGRVWDECI